MEYRDLYDENRNLIGRKILKDEAIPDNTYIMIVLAFIKNSKDEFLIQFTSKEKGSVFSSTGGHAKTGESSLDAMVTETKEELGIEIPREEFTLFYTGIKDKRIFDIYYLEKDIDIDTLTLQKEEVDYVCYKTVNEIKELIENNMFLRSHGIMFYKCLEYLDKEKNTRNDK